MQTIDEVEGQSMSEYINQMAQGGIQSNNSIVLDAQQQLYQQTIAKQDFIRKNDNSISIPMDKEKINNDFGIVIDAAAETKNVDANMPAEKKKRGRKPGSTKEKLAAQKQLSNNPNA